MLNTAQTADAERTTGHARWVLAAIIVLGVAVRIVFLSGFQGHDDRNYTAYAWILAEEGRIPQEHRTQWLGRLGHWVPISMGIKAIGLNEWGLAWYPLACSAAGFVLLWKLGGLWFREPTRLVAAGLLAVMPLDVLFASHAYPDLPLSLWLVLAFYLFLRGERSERTASRWYFAAGLASGIAYLNREDAVFLVGAFACYLMWTRRFRKAYAWMVVGGLVVVVAECGAWAAATDDPLFRYRSLQSSYAGHSENWQQKATEGGDGWTQYLPVPGRLRRGDNPWIEPALMFATNQEFGLIYYFVWPIAIWTLIGRRRGWELALWLAAMALLLCYFPLAFPKTLVRNPRYFCCLTIPAMLLLADWLMRIRPLWRWGIGGLLAGSSLVCVVLDSSRFSMDHVDELRAFADAHSEAKVWMSPKDRFGLFVLEGGDCRPQAPVHLLTTNPGSDNARNVQMVCPELELAGEPLRIDGGYVVVTGDEKVHDKFRRGLPAGWTRVRTIEPRRDPTILRAVALLESIGVPAEYTRRLLSNEGERTEIWRVGEEG